jgi:hypothetical protein
LRKSPGSSTSLSTSGIHTPVFHDIFLQDSKLSAARMTIARQTAECRGSRGQATIGFRWVRMGCGEVNRSRFVFPRRGVSVESGEVQRNQLITVMALRLDD